MPARHLVYGRTLAGLQKLYGELVQAITLALLAAPFDSIPSLHASLPFSAPLDDGHDNRLIWTSDAGHRRMLSNCLEFGSLFLPRYSWASVADLKLSNVFVRAQMRFTRIHEREPPDNWLGIQLRSQGFYANLGILVYVRPSGKVHIAKPTDEVGGMEDLELGSVKPFAEHDADEFAQFELTLDEQHLRLAVDDFSTIIELADLPHVYSRGRVLFETLFSRAGLRRVVVAESAPDEPVSADPPPAEPPPKQRSPVNLIDGGDQRGVDDVAC